MQKQGSGGTQVSGTVFIVEDDPVIAQLIRWRVTELGYTVADAVPSGEEAVEYCRKFRPDAVIMDIKLKGKIDGIEAGKQIKKELKIPLIFLTAHTDEEFLRRAKAAEPDGYITKPFNDNDIRVALKLVL